MLEKDVLGKWAFVLEGPSRVLTGAFVLSNLLCARVSKCST